MRINSQSTLTMRDVIDAIHAAVFTHGQDIYLDEWSQGPRGAKNFYCAAEHGSYATGRNDNSGKRAASWTAYGWVIAELFTRDPNAHIGQYRGRDHFIRTIYGEQRRYIIRESLGVKSRSKIGADCSFLSLFDDDVLTARYNEMR